MKKILINILLNILYKLGYKPEERIIQSITKQDMEIITKAFPVYSYKQGTSTEEIALSVVRCDGEQRVINFILSRIRGRVGAGVIYD